MLHKISVPDTFEGIDRVRVLEYHCDVDAEINPGDLLFELETHKVVIEVRAAQWGIVRDLPCAEGAWCALGAVLAVIGDNRDDPIPGTLAELGSIEAVFQIA